MVTAGQQQQLSTEVPSRTQPLHSSLEPSNPLHCSSSPRSSKSNNSSFHRSLTHRKLQSNSSGTLTSILPNKGSYTCNSSPHWNRKASRRRNTTGQSKSMWMFLISHYAHKKLDHLPVSRADPPIAHSLTSNTGGKDRRVRTVGSFKNSHSKRSSPFSAMIRHSSFLPRVLITIILARFLWYLALLHSATWPDDSSLLPSFGESVSQRRILENFRSGALPDFQRYAEIVPDASPLSESYGQHAVSSRRSRISPPETIVAFSGVGGHSLVDLDTPSRSLKTVTSNHRNIPWKQLCTNGGLNATSRVLIVGGLRENTAALSAFMMAQQCQVKQIICTDSMFPNIRVARTRYMQLYRRLLQKVPRFRLIVTPQGLRRKIDSSPPAWLWDMNPTHILVGGSSPDPNENFASMVLDGMDRYQQYVTQQATEEWLDLFAAIQQRPKIMQPRMVHLTPRGFSSDSDLWMNSLRSTLPASLAAVHGRNITRVDVPSKLYGPGVPLLRHFEDSRSHTEEEEIDNEGLPVVDALVAILEAFGDAQPSAHYRSITLPSASDPSQEAKAPKTEFSTSTAAWKRYISSPFGSPGNRRTAKNSREEAPLWNVIGISPQPLPCSSQCTNGITTCSQSIFDSVIDTSVSVTNNCRFVIYTSNFSSTIAELNGTPKPSEDLCRVAFVSSESTLVKEYARRLPQNATETSLANFNGKFFSRGWRVVWVEGIRSDQDLSVGDAALLRIDPSRLFSPRVKKAMYVSTTSFAGASNEAVLKILAGVDRPATKEGARRYRQERHGTAIGRWVPFPASKPRSVLLFGGVPLNPPNLPEEYIQGRKPKKYSEQQVGFYQQAAHWIHTNEQRPEYEIRSTVHTLFPFQWTTRYFMVHDFTMEESRLLRCEWFDEHISWPGQAKGDLEEMSLAYVLGRYKDLGRYGVDLDNEDGWIPMISESSVGEGDDEDRQMNGAGAEIFLRLMQPRATPSTQDQQI